MRTPAEWARRRLIRSRWFWRTYYHGREQERRERVAREAAAAADPVTAPTAWGVAPGLAEVRDGVLGVLARHGRLDPGARGRLPRPERLGSLRDWARLVLRAGLAGPDLDDLETDAELAATGQLHFDAECVYAPDDYVALVRRFAAATGGQWRPERLRCRWAEDDRDAAVLEFEQDGRPERWAFGGTASDWVQPGCYGHLLDFAERRLPGRFVHLPTPDQRAHYCYLPAALVAELRDVLTWPGPELIVATIRRVAAGELGWHRGYRDACGWLGTWPGLDVPAGDGTLPLHEAVRLDLDSIVDTLLLLGADPLVPDRHGGTAIDRAGTPHLRDRLAAGAGHRVINLALHQAHRL